MAKESSLSSLTEPERRLVSHWKVSVQDRRGDARREAGREEFSCLLLLDDHVYILET